MTMRGTTDSMGILGGGVLILVKNSLTKCPLSTQHLSSLDASSDYLAITVKIKGASPIHLFNLDVPPICSSFVLTLNPSHPTTYIFYSITTTTSHTAYTAHKLPIHCLHCPHCLLCLHSTLPIHCPHCLYTAYTVCALPTLPTPVI